MRNAAVRYDTWRTKQANNHWSNHWWREILALVSECISNIRSKAESSARARAVRAGALHTSPVLQTLHASRSPSNTLIERPKKYGTKRFREEKSEVIGYNKVTLTSPYLGALIATGLLG